MDTTDSSTNKSVTRIPEGCDDFDVESLHQGMAEAESAQPLNFPAPLVVLFAIAAFLAGAYFITLGSGGSTDTAVSGPEGPVPPAVAGERVYKKNCAACHQGTGGGVAGMNPPLAGSEFVIQGNKRPILILLYGMSGPVTVKGNEYNGNMQAWANSLSDEDIANVLTYVRQAWGNSAPPVSEEQVAAMRQEYAGHPQFTGAEMMAMPADEDVPGGETAAAAPAAPAPEAAAAEAPAGG